MSLVGGKDPIRIGIVERIKGPPRKCGGIVIRLIHPRAVRDGARHPKMQLARARAARELTIRAALGAGTGEGGS